MEDDKEGLKDLILEELTRLGVQANPETKTGQGSRLLSINYNSNNSKNNRVKIKGKRSPKASTGKSPHSKHGTQKGWEDKKQTPKSPFAAAKRKAENRRQAKDIKEKGQVFGQPVGHIPSVCVYLTDGTQVTVAEFMVDVCNLIRRNITVEGIFRKAGSSQRQVDLRRLLDSGASLPSNVHVIDAACLLKHFLRSLPEAFLPSDVHSKIVKCMQLAKDARLEAISLCTMLLPQPHRHTLVYLMDFFSDVVASSESNKMDAHNLAIVLAPNLLPIAITPAATTKKGAAAILHSEDAILAVNIEIIQLLIENSPRLCRLPNNVVLALEHREQSRSTENLLTPSESNPIARKKRRSASIHRFVTGLRRVVGHTTGISSPMRMSGSAEHLDSLHLHPGVALSPMPSGSSPRKRKSADAFDLGLQPHREPADKPSPPHSKRAKLEVHVDNVGASATAVDAATRSSSIPIIIQVPSPAKSKFKVVRPFTFEETTSKRSVFSQQLCQTTSLGYSKSSVTRPSAKGGPIPESPGPDFHTKHNGLTRKSLGEAPGGSLSLGPSNGGLLKRPLLKRRSCDVPLRTTPRSSGSVESPLRSRRSSGVLRVKGNEPDGADRPMSSLGRRGVPDGAECILRDRVTPKPDKREILEQHYDDIKSVVKSMEAELDKSNVQQLKDAYFPDSSSGSVQNMSYSEMIQSAYERMRVESKGLGESPSDNLSKRLGKELKIRNRRSGEHRVIRSPSERKIGTIRRRSRELVQNAAKSQITIEDTPAAKPTQTPRMKAALIQTPKMKAALIQTPINASLKRGRPNSVKSGLPFVVRTLNISLDSAPNVEETPNTNRMVVINRRNDECEEIQPLQITNQSLYDRSNENFQTSGTSEVSIGEISKNHSVISRSPSLPIMIGDGSFIEQYTGPMTRRRSSILPESSSLPRLLIPYDTPMTGRNNSMTEINSIEGQLQDTSNKSIMYAHIPSIVCDVPRDEDWIPEWQLVDQDTWLEMARPLGDEEPMDIGDNGEEGWVAAEDFMDGFGDSLDHPEMLIQTVGRPSLAALKKQKKVTANVKLFSNMEGTPGQQRRQSRLRATPYRLPPQRGAASEKKESKLKYYASVSHRATMTPRELLKARQKSFHFDRSPHNLAKVAIVSPLKESTWINIQQEHSRETTKPYHGEATTPQRKFSEDDSAFKTPMILRSAGSNSSVSPFTTPTETPSQPPKLPPRRSIGKTSSSIHVQYR